MNSIERDEKLSKLLKIPYLCYCALLDNAELIVDAMNKKGFWLKLRSPFIPTEQFKPKNHEMVAEWERTKNFWYASFDFHGTVDSRPLWQSGSENPAEAIVLAALKAIEGNPEIFGKE